MLFRNGKPAEEAPTGSGLTPEMLKALIEGVSANVAANIRNSQTVAQTEALLNNTDSDQTLKRLAQAMAKSGGNIEGKNFENLGEIKKVESDINKTKNTLDLLKDIK